MPEADCQKLEEAGQFRLTVEDQRHLVELLANPPATAPALERARDAHARLIRPTG